VLGYGECYPLAVSALASDQEWPVRNRVDSTLISNSPSLQERVMLNQVLGVLWIGSIGC
jgi:hypothetical protein